jgi:choline dehydrogenase
VYRPGVQGLRAVDASVMPQRVAGNTNAVTITIAEKVARVMRGGDPAAPALVAFVEPVA